MQLDQQNSNNTISVNANLIISKYKNKKDRILFCHEKNWWHPPEPGFDSTYFLQVIAGKKKYLPENFSVKHKLGYFRKGTKLDKKYIISKMNGNGSYGDYVPDGCEPMKLSKEFLLTLVSYIDPQLYKEFYDSYKEEVIKRNYNKWSNFNININKDIISDVNNFNPINKNNKHYGGFKLFKNHKSTNVFSQINNIGLPNNRNNEQQEIIASQINQIENLRTLNSQNVNRINELEKQLILKSEENQRLNLILNSKSDKLNNDEIEGMALSPKKVPTGNPLKIQLTKKNK